MVFLLLFRLMLAPDCACGRSLAIGLDDRMVQRRSRFPYYGNPKPDRGLTRNAPKKVTRKRAP